MVNMGIRRRRARPIRRLGPRGGREGLLDAFSPTTPVATMLRQARLRRVRRSLAFTRQIVTRLNKQLAGLEKFIQSALDEEETLDGYSTTEPGGMDDGEDEVGYGTIDEEPGEKPRPKRPTAAGSTGQKITAREKALFTIYADIEGQQSEYTKEGTPRFESVADRLESLSHEPASRSEIDRTFAAYEKQRASRPAKPLRLSSREKALFRIFDDLQGEDSEFTQDGARPKVASVSNRLESLSQEPATREEVEAAYRKYLGE